MAILCLQGQQVSATRPCVAIIMSIPFVFVIVSYTFLKVASLGFCVLKIMPYFVRHIVIIVGVAGIAKDHPEFLPVRVIPDGKEGRRIRGIQFFCVFLVKAVFIGCSID